MTQDIDKYYVPHVEYTLPEGLRKIEVFALIPFLEELEKAFKAGATLVMEQGMHPHMVNDIYCAYVVQKPLKDEKEPVQENVEDKTVNKGGRPKKSVE